MTVEYARHGLVGVLTPQANTTVEPEMGILVPPGVVALTARLVSAHPALDDRLVEYIEGLEESIARFANAPFGAVGFACTGSSYLVGRPREADIVARAGARCGVPVITAGNAVAGALHALGAHRIGLVSPYPAALTEASVRYWGTHGFEVAAVSNEFAPRADAFHPIYSLAASDAGRALARVADPTLEAVVMLGTGLPTLGPILDANRAGGPLVLSCMLCLAWCLLTTIGRLPAHRDSLERFARGEAWQARLLEVTGAPPA